MGIVCSIQLRIPIRGTDHIHVKICSKGLNYRIKFLFRHFYKKYLNSLISTPFLSICYYDPRLTGISQFLSGHLRAKMGGTHIRVISVEKLKGYVFRLNSHCAQS